MSESVSGTHFRGVHFTGTHCFGGNTMLPRVLRLSITRNLLLFSILVLLAGLGLGVGHAPLTNAADYTMDAGKNVTAAVSQAQVTLTVNCKGSGSVVEMGKTVNRCGNPKTYTQNSTTKVILTAAEASGWKFTGWSGAGCSGTGSCTVKMGANRTVTATFSYVYYDFVANAEWAYWRNCDESLDWDTDKVDSGSLMYKNNAMLENGKRADRVLYTHPQWIPDGFIEGYYTDVYDPYIVKTGDSFFAEVGLLDGAVGGDVTFEVWISDVGGNGTTIYTLPDSYDRKLKTLSFPLTDWVGQNVFFTLRVVANETSAQDWAVWKQAYILRP